MNDQIQSKGTIYTFYSFKGGTGRSMALANAAALLAKWGHSVLVVDWDLEAPGLERFFSSGDSDRSLRSSYPGMIDLIESFADGKEMDWKRCVIERYGVSIISAGRADDDYARKVQEVDFVRLFADLRLGSYIEKLRDDWKSSFDFVLIDSRTGVTDVGGICTVHLPDILVAFFTSTESSTCGVIDVVERARKARSKLPVDRSPLVVLPVPSRDESRTEYQKAAEWKGKFCEMFGDLYRDWLPQTVSTSEAVDTLRIPYVPFWSFGEQLPVMSEGTRDSSSISFAYELLARLIANRLDWAEAVEARRLPPPPLTRPRAYPSEWFEKHRTKAKSGLQLANRIGFMEVCHFCLDSEIDKRQSELVDAARRAAVHTFGWPIGVVIDADPDRRPKPITDGIFAEVHSFGGAYDYWALSRWGEFYDLTSLFEDERVEGKLFFDTRVVRVAEAVQHSINLYRALGAESGSRIHLETRHGGLKGRILSIASPNRAPLFQTRKSLEDEVVSPTVSFRLSANADEITQIVEKICAPLFEMFDFQQFSKDVYSDIVTNFLEGRVK